MRKISTLFALLLIGGSLSAQTSGQVPTYTPGVGAQTDGLYLYAMGAISDKLDKLQYEDNSIEGSPYLSNTFQFGQLYYGDELVDEVYFRYNAYNEEIEIKEKNVDNMPIRGLSKDKKIRLVANGKSTSFKTFIDKNGNTKNGYLTLLSDGEHKLYKHLKVTFREGKKAPNSFVKGTPAKFFQYTDYYFESADGKRIDQIEMNNKKITNLVSADKANALKTFLKENQIKVKDENHLYQVVNFLNGQQTGP